MHANGHRAGGSWHMLGYFLLLALIRRRTHNPYIGLGIVMVALFALIGTLMPAAPPVAWNADEVPGRIHAAMLCRQRTGLMFDTTNTAALGLNRYRGRYVHATSAAITLCLVTDDSNVVIDHLRK